MTWHTVPVIVRYTRNWRTLWLRRTPVRATFFYATDDNGVLLTGVLEYANV